MSAVHRLTSALWSVGSATARGLARREIFFKPVRLGVKVISVGNIQVGGAGKTPLVARIATEAIAHGLKACILCRGYGGEWEKRGGLLMPGGEPPSPRRAGDEAVLLHDLVPGAWIGIGADRVRLFREVTRRMGHAPDLVILDDGFQHWRIHKDVEIVAVTSRTRGETFFRDWPRALESASLVVWTKGQSAPDVCGRPMVKAHLALEPFLHTGSAGAKPSPADQSLWLVTGVGDGRGVVDSARTAGYPIQRHLSFGDHHAYRLREVDRLIRDAAAAGCRIALTGKDWVKWRELGIAAGEVVILEPKVVFDQGQELWEKVLWGA